MKGRPLLLVISDDPDIQSLLVLALEPIYELVTAINEREGKLFLNDGERIRGVVCDRGVLDRAGLEKCAKFRQQMPSIPLLLLITSLKEMTGQDLISREIDWLQKPFTISQLQEAIADLIDTLSPFNKNQES
jgi:CheY-like chemotaxis protein